MTRLSSIFAFALVALTSFTVAAPATKRQNIGGIVTTVENLITELTADLNDISTIVEVVPSQLEAALAAILDVSSNIHIGERDPESQFRTFERSGILR
jgi:hypothetical protein